MLNPVIKRYDQYCPVAHALELVGERWSLLIVLELLGGPKRYTDLSAHLPGIGTNILAARLKELEAGGLGGKSRRPPPAPPRVYGLTEWGVGLKPVIRGWALGGLRTLGPPERGDASPAGWLVNALAVVSPPVAPAGHFEFRVD